MRRPVRRTRRRTQRGLAFAGALAVIAAVATLWLAGVGRLASAAPLATAPSGAAAVPWPLPAVRRGEGPIVQVLTFGPGDHPFLKFGHDALRLLSPAGERDDVYNFGTFAFAQAPEQLLKDFLARKLLYWLSRSSMEATAGVYRSENRTIRAQTLALDDATARALQARLEENARPENRAYAYDYFFDNCATRVRDAVDGAVGGALHAVARGPARLSFRAHALRLTADDWPEYLGLSLLLGPLTDRPIDRWREMFLPEVVAETLLAVHVPDATGVLRPLVSADELLAPADRPPSRTVPPDRRAGALLVGLFLGAVGALLLRGGGAGGGRRVRETLDEAHPTSTSTSGRPAAGKARMLVLRGLGGLYVAAWGLVAGGVGSALALAWFGTPHAVAHGNQNLFLFLPTTLLMLPLGVAWCFGASWARTGLMAMIWLGAAAAVGVSLAKLVSLVPFQENGFWVAFTLPVWLGLAWGVHRTRRIQHLR